MGRPLTSSGVSMPMGTSGEPGPNWPVRKSSSLRGRPVPAPICCRYDDCDGVIAGDCSAGMPVAMAGAPVARRSSATTAPRPLGVVATLEDSA